MDLRGPSQVKTESRAQCKAGDPWPTPCAQLDGYNCDVPPTLDFHSRNALYPITVFQLDKTQRC